MRFDSCGAAGTSTGLTPGAMRLDSTSDSNLNFVDKSTVAIGLSPASRMATNRETENPPHVAKK
jgi:hypothetical protein